MPTFRLSPLPAPLPDLDELPREASRTIEVDEADAYPCRRCLRDAEPGERVVLLSYDPFLGDSPYRQAGPIFVHEQPCVAPPVTPTDELPDQLTRRTLSVRCFDHGHLMLDGRVVPGGELADVATSMLADETVAYLHVHNAGAGCFAVRLDRAE